MSITKLHRDLHPSGMEGVDELRADLTAEELRLLNLRVERKLSLEDIAIVLGVASADDPAGVSAAALSLEGQLDRLRQKIRKRGLELGLLGSRRDDAPTPVR